MPRQGGGGAGGKRLSLAGRMGGLYRYGGGEAEIEAEAVGIGCEVCVKTILRCPF